MQGWNGSRWSLSLALAAALHCALLLAWGCMRTVAPLFPFGLEAPVDALELRLIEDPTMPAGKSAPGGGSLAPLPGSAPEQPVKSSEPTRRLVARSPERNERNEQVARHDAPRVENAPERYETDMLASDEASPVAEASLHAARRELLAAQPQTQPAGAPEAAAQVSSSSFRGTGVGSNGGPGGPGRGNGAGSSVIRKQFAFGGPSGAFRADVCFIETTVRRLTDISSCTPVMSFYTSTLDVPPRRFDRGFPGLGRRTAWFAIKYHGQFSVTAEDSYNFRLLSDDGARLEIDGHQVLDNDGQHLPMAVSSNVRLARGSHEFSVFYYQGPPDFLALQLFVKRFAHDEQLFGPVI